MLFLSSVAVIRFCHGAMVGQQVLDFRFYGAVVGGQVCPQLLFIVGQAIQEITDRLIVGPMDRFSIFQFCQ